MGLLFFCFRICQCQSKDFFKEYSIDDVQANYCQVPDVKQDIFFNKQKDAA